MMVTFPFTLSSGVLVSREIYICQILSNYMLEDILFIIYQLDVSEIFKYMGCNFYCFLDKLVTFLLESLLFLAKLETDSC